MSNSLKLITPLFFISLLAPLSSSIDLAVTNHFYEMNGGEFWNTPLFNAIYKYGVVPAQLSFVIGVILFLLSFKEKYERYRKLGVVLSLSLLLGSGLIVNSLLKDHWGRPRPKQVTQFGGEQTFRPFYSPKFINQPCTSRSFPCGHASTGFYFFLFYFLGKRVRNRRLALTGLITALLFGSLIGFTRIVQGGHFFTDVIFSALIMWTFTSWLVNTVYLDEEAPALTTS